MKDSRYVGNPRNMFTPDNQSLVVGDHIVMYGEGADPSGDFEHGTTPYVSVMLDGTTVTVYRDFETGKVVVDVSGDPDRVLFNEATYRIDTNYYTKDGQRADGIKV